ncbi:CaiB/BaiF CoA-transferase family protein [Sphingomonas sp.]|uniref:CaiB/BaiF CoA-transferase family protein n=1 Tax=Sphingomonas sp. TaxID=28214 RepID=UPI000DB8F38C|nr:CaiB/BaiF CoA-transferase family protein [Sphingomonas sp.]PZU06487.1 MAG: hypothetical protein DI605_18725 [Sphingomonas sp.]
MQPLAGRRVLDLGIITAGAGASAVLADMGADVIKIESSQYRDPFRRWPGHALEDGDSPFFRSTNRAKRSLGLNLKAPGAAAVFLRLVANSDVVVENFRRGVLERLGIGFAKLAVANPRIVLASISSQGETGPVADHVSFGSTLEAMGGLSWATGYVDGPPIITGRELNYPDQIATVFGAGMVAAALCGGVDEAVHLDLSQRELTTYLSGDLFGGAIDAPARIGNADPLYVLQATAVADDGKWIAVSVRHDQASLLASIVGSSSEAAFENWLAHRPSAAAVAALNNVGIAADLVRAGDQLLGDDRVWSSALGEDQSGMLVKGSPFLIGDDDPGRYADARPLGGDTRAILRDVGGYDDAAIEELAATGIVEGVDRAAVAA